METNVPVTAFRRKNRSFPPVLIALAASAVALTAGFTYNHVRQPPPNIIVLLIDTLRADQLGLYGGPLHASPNLDRFARDAVVFDLCISQAPWTKPSVASLFTSLYPSQHGMTGIFVDKKTGGAEAFAGQVLSESFDTLPELLKRRSYETAAILSNAWITQATGFGRGFDTVADAFGGKFRTEERALQWLDARPWKGPFFLYIHNMDVHSPYAFEEADYKLLSGEIKAEDDREISAKEANHMAKFGLKDGPAWLPKERLKRVHHWQVAYASAVRRMDEGLGPILDRLARISDEENTIVIITADHGEALGERSEWEHGYTLYQHQLHVPLIVRMPSKIARRVPERVNLVDLLPTIVELTGAPRPVQRMAGRSFAQALRGRKIRERPSFAEGTKPGTGKQFAVIDQGHKAIFRKNTELFHLPNDSRERVNLATSSLRMVKRLGKLMKRHQAETARKVYIPTTQPKIPHAEELRSLGYLQ